VHFILEITKAYMASAVPGSIPGWDYFKLLLMFGDYWSVITNFLIGRAYGVA
jgi:hypothetical protein